MKFKLKNGKLVETNKLSYFQRIKAIQHLNSQLEISEKTRNILKFKHDKLYKDIEGFKALKKELLADLKICYKFSDPKSQIYNLNNDIETMLPFFNLFDKIYQDNKSKFEPKVVQKEIDDLQANKIEPSFIILKQLWNEIIRLEIRIKKFKKIKQELEELNIKKK